MRRWTRFALGLLAATCLVGCEGASRRDAPRAVVIGIDGADWKVIDALAADGRMPNLTALRDRGTSGPIETLVDLPLSPVVWTSVATGVTAAKHGITWFLVDQPDGTRVPVRSHNRRVKAVWNILAEQGLRTTAVGWWATYPAEDVGEGIIVSDALGFHGFGRTAREGDDARKTHPAERFAALDALVPPEQQITAAFTRRFVNIEPAAFREEAFDPARHPQRNPTNPIHLFQQYAVTAQGYAAVSEKLLTEPYDLFLVYFEQVDSFSHLFMKYAPPKLDWTRDEDFERYQNVVYEWYVYQDELLGRLLEKIDLETTAVFVLSDHGFKSGERRIRSEQAVDLRTAHLDHEREGIFVAAGPGIQRGAVIGGASVVDLTPTLLAYLNLPVAKDMDGKVLTGIFEPARMEAQPLRYIASYEGDTGEAPAADPEEDYSAKQLAQNMAALEALGYVEKNSSQATPAGASEPTEASSPEIHNNLGRIHGRTGEIDKAIAEFEKALTLDPYNADSLLNLSSIAALQGNRTRAEHLVKRALAANPDFPPALAQLAELRRDAGDLGEAIRLFGEALELDEVSPDLHLCYGDCLQRAGRFEEAEAAFRRVLELEPDSFAAIYNLGVTASQLDRLDEAITQYERALDLDSKHPLAAATYNNLGTVHLDRGETEQAITRWEQAVEASPAQFEARYNLATQYLEGGRLDDAVALLEEAAQLAPNHEVLNTRLARSYMEQGRGADAYRHLVLVQRLYPENWFAPLGLAVLHSANGRPQEARPLLDDATRLGGEIARAEAANYPALAPLLDSNPAPQAP